MSSVHEHTCKEIVDVIGEKKLTKPNCHKITSGNPMVSLPWSSTLTLKVDDFCREVSKQEKIQDFHFSLFFLNPLDTFFFL